jgi:hypothetical protein
MADHPTDDLALVALRYAAGDLPPPQAAAFEGRMAADPDAREALGEAIRLSAAALHQPVPAPDPLVRLAVREALRPTIVSRLFPRRPYRGHPLAWAGVGAAAAIGLIVVGLELGRPVNAPSTVQAPITSATPPAVQPEILAKLPPVQPPASSPPAAGPLATNLPPVHPGTSPDPLPDSSMGGSGDMTPMGPTGPAIASDPDVTEAGRAPPPRRDPKAGLPEPSPSPSLVMPGGFDW